VARNAARQRTPTVGSCAPDRRSDARGCGIRALRYAAGDLCCACAERDSCRSSQASRRLRGKDEGARDAGFTTQRAGSCRAVITRIGGAPPRSCMAHRAHSMNGLSEGIEVNRFDQVHVEARLS
jgi:hypothetical protein